MRWVCTALCAVSALACGGDDEGGFAIRHNQRPGASCELEQRATSQVIRDGVFDLSIGDRFSYVLTPLVRNATNRPIAVTGARVHASQQTPAGPARLRFMCDDVDTCDEWDLSICTLGVDDCPVVESGGTASFEVPVMARVVTGYFQGMLDGAVREGRNPPEFDLVLSVTLIGISDGEEILSEPFEYEVTVCLGCLVDYPPGTDSSVFSGPDCCGGTSNPPPCYPGQDDLFSCTLCTRSLPELCNFGRLTCG